MSVKIDRISSEVGRIVSEIMLLEARDETLKHVTVTGCVVTNDLSFANIYYTYMGDESLEDVKKNLEVAAPYLRTVLASKIELRHTPELRFHYDNSVEYGQNIERIINELHEEEK
ncbi:MAG: 30S ribosome-binding factor RbfA [Bacilli bacterium]|mgnify:FL=1|jgi:ribosome-binding factor A|nr:30S ribosome-binding factor RbfA [Bacilli bacterium]